MFSKLTLKSKAFKSLLGALLIKFATSVTSCWGSINLYFLSCFYNQGFNITPQTNAIILFISVIPMLAALILSTKLCRIFGFDPVIRFACAMFLLSPMTSLLVFHPYTFILFSIVIPGSAFALTTIPILNCMWSHFPESKNKITALLVIGFGLGGVLWNLLFLHLINPHNQPAKLKVGNINFFSTEITQNVRITSVVGFAVTGIIAGIGSLLIEKKADAEEFRLTEQIQGETERTTASQNNTPEQSLTIKTAVKDERFILIMLVSFFTGLYEIHLMMNFKIIFMPLITDDHFLTYSIMLCTLVSIGGAFLWGCLGDLKGISFTILVLSVLDLLGKIFSDFAITKPTVLIMVILVGLVSKSMTTLAGPGFVEFFGLHLGTELLPFKGAALLLGYVMVPCFQLLTANFLTPHGYLIAISFASIATLGCSVRLYLLTNKLKKDELNYPEKCPEMPISTQELMVKISKR